MESESQYLKKMCNLWEGISGKMVSCGKKKMLLKRMQAYQSIKNSERQSIWGKRDSGKLCLLPQRIQIEPIQKTEILFYEMSHRTSEEKSGNQSFMEGGVTPEYLKGRGTLRYNAWRSSNGTITLADPAG